MLGKKRIFFNLGAVIVGGALLSLFYLVIKTSPPQALLIGYFNAVTFAATLWLLRKLLLAKLFVFTTDQQWILRTFIYTILACFVYLTGLMFQYLVLTPIGVLGTAVIDKLWQVFLLLLSDPLRSNISAIFGTKEFSAVIVPFFALIFLFGISSMLGSYIEIKWRGDKHTQIMQKTQLTALQAQVEPHFLFNTLNTIAATIKSNPQQAENLVLQLSDLFRYIFENAGKEMTELENEITVARKYTELLKARYGDLLQLEWQQNLSSSKQKVPVFIIQPILENSIRHGWSADRKHLVISVNIQEDDRNIVIEIKDNGIGMKPDLIKQVSKGENALGNIAERLQLVYKNQGRMDIISELTAGTRVRLTIPRGAL
jgi:hypothetical protein